VGVVEGTLDAMAIAVAAVRSGTAGQFCPVTQSGRELSAKQLEQAVSLNDGPLVLAFDGDAAGRESARRHAMTAVRLGHGVFGHHPAGRSRPGLLAGGERRPRAQSVGSRRCSRSRPSLAEAGSCPYLPCDSPTGCPDHP
jgi:hypothetical protein